jgi:3-oxoacyl-[acyl-carrier protein] reductase
MGLVDGKTAVITGGAGGLGLAMAHTLLDEGANVVLTDVSPDALERAVADLDRPERTATALGSASDPEAVSAAAAVALESFGSLDVWVNNAGFTRDATMRKMTLEDFDSVIDVHLRGAWLGTREAARIMRERGSGSIINVSSISGKVGNIGQTNYSAAKAGIVGLTKAAAKEVGFAGVRVNAIQPGIISTPMTDAMPDRIRESRLAEVPLGRFGQPSEVANVVLFLASDLSSYLTGIVIEISGGRNI